MSSKRQDYGEHNDYSDHGDQVRQVRRVPLDVILNRFLVLILAIVVFGMALYFGLLG